MSEWARALHTVCSIACVRGVSVGRVHQHTHSLTHTLTNSRSLALLVSHSIWFELFVIEGEDMCCIEYSCSAITALCLSFRASLWWYTSHLLSTLLIFFPFTSLSLSVSTLCAHPHSLSSFLKLSISFTFNFRCYDSSTNKPILFSDCCFLLLILLFSANLACINVISTNFGLVQIRTTHIYVHIYNFFIQIRRKFNEYFHFHISKIFVSLALSVLFTFHDV